MDELKNTIAKNLIYYRTQAKLTQFELATKLNYSDKSISKWERGAGIPDVVILKQLADLYGIKVDDFFSEENPEVEPENKTQNLNIKHLFIMLLSVGLVWVLASVVFVALLWLNIPKSWLSFITAIPVTMIVLVVLSRIWYKPYIVCVFVSLLIWTLALTIYLFTIKTHSYYLFIICIPLQVLVALWFVFRSKILKQLSK